ncbi:VOC family protein [Nocardia stercoris]|uniref:VOC family protein n=1 Tax=Nocardia stercoris TaxID=2483361 RepID=A0A3M2L889_9NOCA|nr:VOC family protein [Nocardia stercoris]RMI32723.1 VOC family protein [Nocardia stercoris]
MTATLSHLGLPGDETAWAALGFTIVSGTIRIGQVVCTVGEHPSWAFADTHADQSILAVPAPSTSPADLPADAGVHPNGITKIDHVVYEVADLDASVEALTAVLGTPPRKRFHPRGPEGPEMAFYRAGEAVIEVVASGKPPHLLGLAFRSPDLDATVAAVRTAGAPIGDPKPSVQGGRIASIWSGYVNWGLAVMESAPR